VKSLDHSLCLPQGYSLYCRLFVKPGRGRNPARLIHPLWYYPSPQNSLLFHAPRYHIKSSTFESFSSAFSRISISSTIFHIPRISPPSFLSYRASNCTILHRLSAPCRARHHKPNHSANSPVRPLLVQHSVTTLLTSDCVAAPDGHFRAAVSADVGRGFVGRLVEGVAALTGSVEESWVAGNVGFVVGHDDVVRVCVSFITL